jgi:hypothetical protein
MAMFANEHIIISGAHWALSSKLRQFAELYVEFQFLYFLKPDAR